MNNGFHACKYLLADLNSIYTFLRVVFNNVVRGKKTMRSSIYSIRLYEY